MSAAVAPLRQQKHKTIASRTLTDLEAENRIRSRTSCISHMTSVRLFIGSLWESVFPPGSYTQILLGVLAQQP